MDLPWEGPPCNPLQEATVYQALQCFADRLSCLSLKKKKKKQPSARTRVHEHGL